MRTTYDATVRVNTKEHLDVDRLMTALAEYRPVLQTSPEGWHEIRISVSAANLAHACHTAIAVATAATGATAISAEIMTRAETDVREHADLPRQGRPRGAG
jgi:phage-related protein